MTNRPKQIGTDAEMGVVEFLERLGATDIYRPALQGTLDRGDVHYRYRGQLFVVSVKGGRMAETATPEQCSKWLAECALQASRTPGAEFYLVTKRAGIGRKRAELWRAHRGGMLGGIWTTDLATMAAR